MREIKNILEKELHKVTDPLGIRVIELTVYSGKNGLHIRAVIHKYNGVTLNDCEQVTRLFNDRIDVLEIVDRDGCTVEISSPGINRVLKRKEEYEVFRSRRVKVILKEPLEKNGKKREHTGELQGLKDDIVTLGTEDGVLSIPYDTIAKTKLQG